LSAFLDLHLRLLGLDDLDLRLRLGHGDLRLLLRDAHLRLRHPHDDFRLRDLDGDDRRRLPHDDLRLRLAHGDGRLRLLDRDLRRRLVDGHGRRRLLDDDVGALLAFLLLTLLGLLILLLARLLFALLRLLLILLCALLLACLLLIARLLARGGVDLLEGVTARSGILLLLHLPGLVERDRDLGILVLLHKSDEPVAIVLLRQRTSRQSHRRQKRGDKDRSHERLLIWVNGRITWGPGVCSSRCLNIFLAIEVFRERRRGLFHPPGSLAMGLRDPANLFRERR
jgi:hypothetical protein